MTPSDRAYLKSLLARGILHGPVLEVGSQAIEGQGGNTEATCQAAGLEWEGADIAPGPGVSRLLDMADTESVNAVGRQWNTVLIFNTLEHVYDPVCVLRNAVSLTAVSGHCVVITPTVWQLHDYPADYWRPLPDFYLEFARREGCSLISNGFCWILGDRMIDVDSLRVGSQKLLPSKGPLGEKVFGRSRLQASRAIHRLFNTVGRELFFPYSALAAVLRRDTE